MKISIITAVFNRVNYIAHALTSLQCQTHTDFEHIVIDGASTDGTVDILKERLGDRSLLISEPDHGIYDALNKGLIHTSGEIIGILHSDDFFADETVLEKVAKAFSNPLIDAVYGDLDYVSKLDKDKVIRRWHPGEYSDKRLSFGWMPPHPTVFLRRRVIEQWGNFDTQFRISSDYDAMLRYFGKGKIYSKYIPYTFVRMRVGGESNRSLRHIWLKTREDYKALRRNRVGGVRALVWKNLSKLNQFF